VIDTPEVASFEGGPIHGKLIPVSSLAPTMLYFPHRVSSITSPSTTAYVVYKLRMRDDGFPSRADDGIITYDYVGEERQ
jgi:hypothetical protein